MHIAVLLAASSLSSLVLVSACSQKQESIENCSSATGLNGTYVVHVGTPVSSNSNQANHNQQYWKITESSGKITIEDICSHSTIVTGTLEANTLKSSSPTSAASYLFRKSKISGNQQFKLQQTAPISAHNTTSTGVMIQDAVNCNDPTFEPIPVKKCTTNLSAPASLSINTVITSCDAAAPAPPSCTNRLATGDYSCPEATVLSGNCPAESDVEANPFCSSVPANAEYSAYCAMQKVKLLVHANADSSGAVIGAPYKSSLALKPDVSTTSATFCTLGQNNSGPWPSVNCGDTSVDKLSCTSTTTISNVGINLSDSKISNASSSTLKFIFPGSILQGGPLLRNGTFTPVTVPTAPSNVFFQKAVVSESSNGCISLNGCLSEHSLQSATDANNRFLASEIISTEAAIKIDTKSIISQEDLDYKLGRTSFANDPNVDLSGLKWDSTSPTNVLIVVEQIWYKMCVPPPEHPYSFFKDQEKFTDPNSELSTQDNPALYVACVTYGRKALLLASSQKTEAELRDAINAGYGRVVAGSQLRTISNSRLFTLSRAKFSVILLGGSSEYNTGLVSMPGDIAITKTANLFKGVGSICACNTGSIIGYELRYLNGNYEVFAPTQYTKITTACTPVPGVINKIGVRLLFVHGTAEVYATASEMFGETPSQGPGFLGEWSNQNNPTDSMMIPGDSPYFLKIQARLPQGSKDPEGLGYEINVNGIVVKSMWAQYSGNNWRGDGGGSGWYFSAIYYVDPKKGTVEFSPGNGCSAKPAGICSQVG